MIRVGRRSIAIACALMASLPGILATACTSTDDAAPEPDRDDAGDASMLDESSTSDAARPDAGEILVDTSVPAVTCATTPCAVEIAAGFDSACVRMSDGTVRCWGSNTAGELGRGDDAPTSANAPAPVVGLDDAVQLSGSASLPSDVYCALRANGAVVCWGSNENGVLGRSIDGTVDTTSSGVPAPVEGLRAATGIFAGHHVSCATFAGTDVACWGSNAAAQIPERPHGDGELFAVTTFSIGAKSKMLALADRGTVAWTEGGLVSWGRSGAPLGPETGVLGR